jgi:hypothetical protein
MLLTRKLSLAWTGLREGTIDSGIGISFIQEDIDEEGKHVTGMANAYPEESLSVQVVLERFPRLKLEQNLIFILPAHFPDLYITVLSLPLHLIPNPTLLTIQTR